MELTIVVAPDCPMCGEARAIAAAMRARLPALRVELVELDGDRPLPPQVFATPTYLLDGAVYALGNPEREELARELERRQSSPVGPPVRGPAARAAPPDAAAAPRSWPRQSLAAGVVGSVVASFCCLPLATALALGLSLGTIATLGRLLAYQRLFELAGVLGTALAGWWIHRRSRMACGACWRDARERARLPLYVCGAFALGFAALNLGLIPLLEHVPWLLAGQ